MFVYVLFITVIFISPTDHMKHETSKALKVLPTMEECFVEMKDMAQKMAQSYPGESDYEISCKRRKQAKQSINPPNPERQY